MVPNHTNQSVNAKNQYKDLTYKRKIKAEKTALDFRKQNNSRNKNTIPRKNGKQFFFSRTISDGPWYLSFPVSYFVSFC